MDERAAAVDRDALAPVVRRALGSATAEVAEWQHSRLPYVNALADHRGLYRFAGTARDAGETVPWSAILKLLRPAPGGPTDISHPAFFWRREAQAYGSGLLADIPGLRAPRCFGVTEFADETGWLWLEEIHDVYDGDWPLERYETAARHLGQFSGTYVSSRPLPSYPWLHARLPGSGAPMAEANESTLHSDDTWRHPLLRRAFPQPVTERFLKQLQDRRAFRAALAQLPRVVCHYDFGKQNLFARYRGDGEDETVAVDWELMGIGPLATDMTALVIMTLRRFAVDMADAQRLEEAVLTGFLEGLTDAGWRGDPKDIRRGHLAAVALRLGLVPSIVSIALDKEHGSRAEQVWGRPLEEIVRRWAELAYFVLDRADEARTLLREA